MIGTTDDESFGLWMKWQDDIMEAILAAELAGNGCGRRIGPFPCCSVVQGDCLELMKQLPDGCVDAVITSPPYNQNIDGFGESGMHAETSWVSKISSGYSDSKSEPEYQKWQLEILGEASRLLAAMGSVFYNHKIRWRDGVLIHPVKWTESVPMMLRQEIIWKRNGSVTLNARMFAPSEERILWFDKGRHKWNQDAMKMSVWEIDQYGSFGRQYDGINGHPCAFPDEIPHRCISATTDESDTVLEPFAGSGTTLVAAKKLGRHFLGFEISTEYCAIARRRLDEIDAQPTLFEQKPEQLTL